MNLKDFVENNDNLKPFVIPKCTAVKSWGLYKCTLEKLSDILKEKPLKFRVGLKSYNEGSKNSLHNTFSLNYSKVNL